MYEQTYCSPRRDIHRIIDTGVPPQDDDPRRVTTTTVPWSDEDLEGFYKEYADDCDEEEYDERDILEGVNLPIYDEYECQAIVCPFDSSAFSELSEEDQADALLSCRLLFGPARRRIDLEGLAGTGLFSVHRI